MPDCEDIIFDSSVAGSDDDAEAAVDGVDLARKPWTSEVSSMHVHMRCLASEASTFPQAIIVLLVERQGSR